MKPGRPRLNKLPADIWRVTDAPEVGPAPMAALARQPLQGWGLYYWSAPASQTMNHDTMNRDARLTARHLRTWPGVCLCRRGSGWRALVGATGLAASLLMAVTAPVAAAPISSIAGTLDNLASGQPAVGVCVYAYSQGLLASPQSSPLRATTAGDGSYEVDVPSGAYGSYAVEFDPSCGGTVVSPYALQWYFDASDRQSASSVDSYAAAPITGIDAHLVPGYSVSGTVDIPGGAGAAGVCVTAQDPAGNSVSSTKTTSAGAFSVTNLAAGEYLFYADPTCGGAEASSYASQYVEVEPGSSSTTKLNLSADTTGIDFVLAEQAVVSGHVGAGGTTDETGICVYAKGADGGRVSTTRTTAEGAYRVTNLAAGTYRIEIDPTCQGSQQSYFTSAGYGPQLALLAGQTVSGADVALKLAQVTPLSITRRSLVPGLVSSPYCETISMAGPDMYGGGYTSSATGLPVGMRLSSVEGVGDEGISGGSRCRETVWGPSVYGYPLHAGTYHVKVTVSTVGAVPNLVVSRQYELVVKSHQVSIASKSATISGKYVSVKLACAPTRAGIYNAALGAGCSGVARLATTKGSLLAEGAYTVGDGRTTAFKLNVTHDGLIVLARAKQHPVTEELMLSLSNVREAGQAVTVS
jgi:Carboxypeptidase regulatory-like domain